MLGLRSIIVEVVSRSVLTSNELLSSFAEKYNLPDPTRPKEHQHLRSVTGTSRSAENRPTSRPLSITPIATAFVDTFDAGPVNDKANSTEIRTLYRIAESMCGLRGLAPLAIQDRKWRVHSYSKCWIGSEAVDWLIAQNIADNRRIAVGILTRMMKAGLFKKVSNEAVNIFHDALLFYRFESVEFNWPIMHLKEQPSTQLAIEQAEGYFKMIEQEFFKLKIPPNTDLCKVMRDMITYLGRHFHKVSISMPSNSAIATTVVGGTSSQSNETQSVPVSATSAPSPTTFMLISSATSSQSSSSKSESNSELHHSLGSSSACSLSPPFPPESFSYSSINSLTTLSLTPKQFGPLRRTGHFQGIELVRYFKKQNIVHTTRDAVILSTYLFLLPFHRPNSVPMGSEAFFLPVGKNSSISSDLFQKVQLLDWHEQQQSNQSPFPYPSQPSEPANPDVITVQRKLPTPPNSPPKSSTPGISSQLYHMYLRESVLPGLPFELRSTFTNAEVWYRLMIPFTDKMGTTSAQMQFLPGAVNTQTTTHHNTTPHLMNSQVMTVPPLGLHSLQGVDTLDGSMPSLVRNHYISAAKSVGTPFPNPLSVMGGMNFQMSDQDLYWDFVQSFGDDTSAYEFDDADDLVTAVEFNHSGEFLAIGDKAGRVSIVQESVAEMRNGQLTPLEYKFYTEFQSHEPEFDCLKSTDIEPKINVIEWWKHHSKQKMLLTCNDRTIKLWRLGPKTQQRRSMESFVNGVVEELPPTNNENGDEDDDTGNVGATRKQLYKNAHGYNIHSLAVNSDGETFFSADDLRINLWNIERGDECFNIVDLKPAQVGDVDELITVARFHPIECNTFLHGSSKGVLRLVDMRQRALVDRGFSEIFIVPPPSTPKPDQSNFKEIIDSILDARFSEDGRYILSRDFMTLRLWDTRKPAVPVYASQVHPYVESQLLTLLDNECIFDQFQCAMSRDGLHFVSGSYSNSFTLHNVLTQRTCLIKARDDTREPMIINQHYNYSDGSVGNEPAGQTSPPVVNHYQHQQSQPWRTSDFAPQTLSNINVIGAGGDNVHQFNLQNNGLASDGSKMPHPSDCFNQTNPSRTPNYRKKVLKVAWHPRMNAVAVAGLYKLYLYQAKSPSVIV